MTRKGLAFGAGVSLLGASLVGLPAQAAGIQDGSVVLADTLAFGNTNMLTTGYIDISASFSGAAQSGANLKLYVNDPDDISIYDVVRQGASDNASTPVLTAIYEDEVTGSVNDKITAAFGSASGLQAGDVVDGAAIDFSSVTTEVETFLNANTDITVTSVREIAAGNMTSVVITKGATPASDPATFVITKTGHGIVAGDVIEITSAALPTLTTDTAATVAAAMNGYHVVDSATTDTFTISYVDADVTTTQTAKAFDAGTVEVHTATFTADATVDTAVSADELFTAGSSGTFADLTQSDALSDVAQMRELGFGYNAMLGVATTLTKSSTAATLYDYVVDTNNTDRTNGDQVVRFATSGNTADGALTVTAWIDDDNDNKIDTTEYASAAMTINFVEPANATYTISQENVFISSDTVTGIVTADLNLAEIGAQSLLTLSIDHNDAGTVRDEGRPTLTFDATDENLQATDSDLNGDTTTTVLAAGDSIRFAVESATVEVGTAATFGVGSRTVAGSVLSIPATVNNTRGYNEDADGTSMSSQAVTVRKGTAAVTGVVSVVNGDPTDTTADLAVANVPYTITITSSSVTAADGVAFNGKVVDGGTETITGYTLSLIHI